MFGLHPWDIRRLTMREFDLYCAEADAWHDANQKAMAD